MNIARIRWSAGAVLGAVLFLPQGLWAQGDVAAAIKQVEQKQIEAAPVIDFFKKTQVGGYVDFYYAYNTNRPEDQSIGSRGVNTNHNSFQFNAAKLSFNRPVSGPDTVGYRLDLVFGPLADSFNVPFEFPVPGRSTDSIQRNVLNAFVSYSAPVGKGLNIDVGKFTTFIGAEGFDTFDNWNYQQGIMFSFAQPYYHTGVRATYAASDMFTVGVYAVNGWNNSFDQNTGKSVGGSIAATINETFQVSQNYLGGPENGTSNDGWRHLYDGVVNAKMSDNFALRFNYDIGANNPVGGGSAAKWYGIAGSARFSTSDGKVALTPRFEILHDDAGFATGMIQDLKTITVTNEYKIKKNLSAKLEYRYDFSTEPIFKKLVGQFVDNQHVFLVGFVTTFGVGQD